MVGEEEEKEQLAGEVLEVMHFCSPYTWGGAEKENATDGGGDQGRRQGGLANKDH